MAKTVQKKRTRKAKVTADEGEATTLDIDRAEYWKRRASKIGRPSKYNPAMLDVVLELAAEGKSVAQICADERIDISRETFYRWAEEIPEFRDTVTRAKDLCQAWWEDAGQKGMWLGGSGFNANAWSLQIRNRFPEHYSDRRDVGVHGDGKAIQIQLVREIVDPPDRDADQV